MSKAEALLLSLTENVHTHEHVVTDNDSYFVINPDTHEIENASRTKNVIMQYDHNSEKFTFELARYVEGHDMMLCNRVRVHFNNIDGTTLEENADVAELYDLAPCPDDENKVVCSWSITRQATQLAGTLNFLVQYECIDDAGETVYEWHTDIYDKVEVRKGRNNSEQAIVEYSNILEQWYQRIFGTGESVMADIANAATEQISAITAEGEKQVADVNAEGDAQKEAVALKGEETLATIPADYTTTYNMAEEALRRKANAIELEAEGESIFVDDSSDAHLLGLNVKGRSAQIITSGNQLFDASALATSTKGGATVTNNIDGSFTVSGSGKLTTGFIVQKDYTHEETLNLLRAGTLNAIITKTYPYWYIQIRNNNTVYFALTHSKTSQNITDEMLSDPEMFMRVGFYGDSGADIITGTIKPVLYQDGDGEYEQYTGGMPSPSPEYPQEITSVENSVVSVYGKNLIRNELPVGVVHDRYGVSFTSNADGSIYVSGTPTNAVAFNIMDNVFMPAGTYCLSGAPVGASTKFRLQVNYKPPLGSAEKTGAVNMLEPVKFTLPYDAYVRAYIYIAYDHGYAEGTFYPQLELGAVATEYEPYKPVQNLTIDRTLRGIPVTTGGNYTDSKGQQWICDEIDFERGMLVQRVVRLQYNGTESWRVNTYYPNTVQITSSRIINKSPVLCDMYSNVTLNENNNITVGNAINVRDDKYAIDVETWTNHLVELAENETPFAMLCILATPIEISLTEEELGYYKKLKTNYHNTTVLNDFNAHMGIKYAADTLIYMRDHQPKPTDEQVQSAVNEYASQNGVQVPSDDRIREIAKESGGEALTDEEVTSLLALLD